MYIDYNAVYTIYVYLQTFHHFFFSLPLSSSSACAGQDAGEGRLLSHRGHLARVPVKSEKLRVGFVKLQQLEGELSRAESSENKMEVYERLLMECQDAMQLVRDELGVESVSEMGIDSCRVHFQGLFTQALIRMHLINMG